MRKRAFNILKYLLVALFVSYYAESTLFFHTHTFSWGTVTHSHPYMPSAAHSHTTTECQTIQLLTNLVFTSTGTIFVAVTFRVITLLYRPRLHSWARYLLENTSLRGPPLSIC
ncbi:MAG: hypothetical protein RSC11_02650 [Mucinivorans sp.]